MDVPKPQGVFPYFVGENPYNTSIDLAFQKILRNFATMKKICLLLLICFLRLDTTAQTKGFSIDTLSNTVFARMQGKSYPEGCTIKRSTLRYLQVLHYDADGKIHRGELVCHQKIAADLLDIFQKLYEAHYPIERMTLVDNYEADDERSMTANNTSCFCYRVVTGSKSLSKHAQGMAIDINPLQNPCVKKRKDGSIWVQPKAGIKYTNRNSKYPYKIEKGDLCYRLFIEHGFSWGGNWRSTKDYQHFEK